MEDDGPLQGLGDLLAAVEVALDELDPEVVLRRAGQPGADIAATGKDQALVGLFQALQLAHHGGDVTGRGDEEDLVVGLDDGVARRFDGPLLAIDGRDPGLHVRHVVVEGAQGLADQGATLVGPYRHQSHSATGEVQDLEAAGMLEQAQDVLGDQLFRADTDIDRQGPGGEEFRVLEKARGPHPGDAGGRVEEGVGHLTGDHVGLIAVGDRQDDMGILRTGPLQDVGMGAVTMDGAEVEAVLKLTQQGGILVHHRDVVGLAGEVGGHGPADLAGAEDDDLHISVVP